MVSRACQFEIKCDARKEQFSPIFKVRASEALYHAFRSCCCLGLIIDSRKCLPVVSYGNWRAYFEFLPLVFLSHRHTSTTPSSFYRKIVLFLFFVLRFLSKPKNPDFWGSTVRFFSIFLVSYFRVGQIIVSVIWNLEGCSPDRSTGTVPCPLPTVQCLFFCIPFQ